MGFDRVRLIVRRACVSLFACFALPAFAQSFYEAPPSDVAGKPGTLVRALGQDLPADRPRPEPGQAGQIVTVNDDVESDGYAGSMRGTLDRIPKPAVLPRTGRSPEVTPRDSAQIV